jgi:hypothetical protein
MSTVPDPFDDSSSKSTRPRRYFSARTGRDPSGAKVDLALLWRLFASVFTELRRKAISGSIRLLLC